MPERSAWVIPKLPVDSSIGGPYSRDALRTTAVAPSDRCVLGDLCGAAGPRSRSAEVFDQSDMYLKSAFVRSTEARAHFALLIPIASVYPFTLGASKCA